MKKLFLLFLLIGFTFFSSNVSAYSTNATYLNNYKYYSNIITPSVAIPTFVDVPLNDHSISDFSNAALYNVTKDTFDPFIQKTEQVENLKPYVFTGDSEDITASVTDNNPSTYAEFTTNDSLGSIKIIYLKYAKPITTSALQILLDPTSTKPYYVSIRNVASGYPDYEENYKILANRRQLLGTKDINFTTVTASYFEVSIEYTEPVRISELKFTPLNTTTIDSIRFLAQPDNVYKIYFGPQTYQILPVGESPDFNSVPKNNLISASLGPKITNQVFTPLDSDKDSILDTVDNCPNVSNTDQLDTNSNRIGDVCEDFDSDSVLNYKDNCQSIPNRNQMDKDVDGIGDACDPDESRFIEKYFWIPWLGILFGFGAVSLILFSTKTKLKRDI